MGNGTSIGKVRGLGSSHHGAHHWLTARTTAIGNLVLMAWLLVSFLLLSDFEYETVVGWISKPLAAAALAATVVGVGAGTAAAGEGRDAGNDEPTVEETGLAQEVQLEGADADVETEEDGEGRRGRRGRRGQVLSTAADFLGVEASEIREEIQDGATLAEVVVEAGFSVDDLVAEIVANVEERLDAKVESGDITEEEAAEKLESKTERIEDRINGIDNDDNDENDENDDDDVDAEEVSA